MSSIDSRIVTMKFDNKEFQANAGTTLSTLDKLKQSMNFGNIGSTATRGLGAIGTVLSKFGLKNPFATATAGANELNRTTQSVASQGLSTITGGITSVSAGFVAMSTVAITALSNITSRAVSAGLNFARSFTVAPILDGLHEYQTTLQSIQTVQANTDRPLPEIEAALQRLNAYSDTTIYNFGQMAKNVGTFTAAGVDLQTSVASIQGIANIAALSGSSADQAATAMYQLSQAIAAGKVGLMDWNSVVNAGMGGKKLQNALLQTAVAMGKIGENSVKLEGPMKKLTVNGHSFRESIMAQPGQESWLSSDILVNTLASLDGRFSVAYQKAQLTADGVRKFTDAQIKSNMAEARANLEKKNGVKYSDEQYAALLKMANAATSAAQDVKTLGQVFDIAKETIGSGWAASFKSIFGNLSESKKLFTDMSNGLGNVIRQNALARNTMLKAWHDKGGRAQLIDALTTAVHSLGKVISTVTSGFRTIIPGTSAKSLLELTKRFDHLMTAMKPSTETLSDLFSIGRGVAAVFDILRQIVVGVAHGLGVMFTAVGGGSGSFLGFVAQIANAIANFDMFLRKSGLIETFFTGLGHILSVPLALLRGVATLIGSIFAGFDTGAANRVTGAVDGVGDSLSILDRLAAGVSAGFEAIGHALGGAAELIGNTLANMGNLISGAITPETFSQSLGVINTALLGGIVLMLRNFFSKGFGVNIGTNIGSGVGESIKNTLGAATGALEQMQGNLKADILLKIASALALLTASIFVLSTIPGEDLRKSLLALGIGLAGMQASMMAMLVGLAKFGIFKISFVAGAIVALAASLVLLSLAVKIMASMEFGDMMRGLFGLWVALKIIQGALEKMNLPGIVASAAALLLLGVALNAIALALKIFATMSWDEMAHGLVALAGSLAVIGVTMRLMPNNMIITAAGLVILGAALFEIAGALKLFATLSWDDMLHGLAALAGALVIIALAMSAMPLTLPITAAGLVLVGLALIQIAGAVKIMGSMGWDEIAKGLIVLGGAMAILALGLNAIGVVGTIGAVGLMLTAAALAVLAPVILAFGAMDWMAIIKSMTVLAGVFLILGVAGTLMAPLVPVLLGLGLALILIGAGFALAGVGALLFATAIATLVAAGTAGIGLLVDYVEGLLLTLPHVFRALGASAVAFAQGLASQGPKLVTAMAKIIGAMLDAIIKNVPKMGRAFMVMLNTGLRIISQMSPKIFNAGLNLILGFLRAINSHIGEMTRIATDIVVKFLNAWGNNSGRMIDAGVRAIIKFINGISDAIDNHSAELGRAGGRLAGAIVRGIIVGIGSGASSIADAARNAARDALHAAADFLGVGSPSKVFRDQIGKKVSEGFALGIDDNAHMAVRSAEGMGRGTLDVLKNTMAGVSDALDVSADMNPTISPVLDLSALTRDANRMSGILATSPIQASASFAAATELSNQTQATQQAVFEAASAPVMQEVKFEQTNVSPKALTPVEIYRNTRNQLSFAKEALKPS